MQVYIVTIIMCCKIIFPVPGCWYVYCIVWGHVLLEHLNEMELVLTGFLVKRCPSLSRWFSDSFYCSNCTKVKLIMLKPSLLRSHSPVCCKFLKQGALSKIQLASLTWQPQSDITLHMYEHNLNPRREWRTTPLTKKKMIIKKYFI